MAQVSSSDSQPAAAKASADWQVGAVVDVAYSPQEFELGARQKGLALGHSDVSASGKLGKHLQAQATLAVHQHEKKVEAEIEELWLQTRTLPAGLQLRAGRFSSQIGYLNEQHPHADDFSERPLLYRAFLGGHWFDDGVRLNWTAPTDFYLRLGAEVFNGRQLVKEAASQRKPGAIVLSARTGGDIGTDSSWQVGASYLRNWREAALDNHSNGAGGGASAGMGMHDEHEGEEDHEDEDHHAGGGAGGHNHAHHSHAHGAAFSGAHMTVLDATWKWAPGGNNREQQVKVNAEYAVVKKPNRYALAGDQHRAAYLAAVWRFKPDWELGARSDWLQASIPHGQHFHAGKLRENAVMLAYKPTHMQTLRLQYSEQKTRAGFENPKHGITLQYIISFGAHGAHIF